MRYDKLMKTISEGNWGAKTRKTKENIFKPDRREGRRRVVQRGENITRRPQNGEIDPPTRATLLSTDDENDKNNREVLHFDIPSMEKNI